MRITVIVDTDRSKMGAAVKDKSIRTLGAVVDLFAYALSPLVNLIGGISSRQIARHYSNEEGNE